MGNKKRRPHGDPLTVLGRTRAAVLLDVEHLTELEIVFELYCALWDQAGDMPPRDALHLVLEELEASASDDLRAAVAELRALPFVESPPGTMSDRDRTWFGLQIMLNQLLNAGKRLLSDELRAQAGLDEQAEGGTAGVSPAFMPGAAPHGAPLRSSKPRSMS